MTHDSRSPWLYCPDCGAALRVTHVHRLGYKRATKHACTRCPYKAISVAVIMVERPRYGTGFDAVSRQLPLYNIKRTDDE